MAAVVEHPEAPQLLHGLWQIGARQPPPVVLHQYGVLRKKPAIRGRRPAPRNFSGSLAQVLSAVSWCHPSLPLSSPPRFSPHSRLMSSVPSILTAVLMVVSSPRRRVVVRPARARRASRRASRRLVVVVARRHLAASPPRHRRVVASSPYTAILTHPLPGSSEAGEGGSEACGDLGCCEGAPGRCVRAAGHEGTSCCTRQFSSEIVKAPGPAATVRKLGGCSDCDGPKRLRRRLVVASSSRRRAVASSRRRRIVVGSSSPRPSIPLSSPKRVRVRGSGEAREGGLGGW